jgi:hypothetical protein
MPMGSEKGIIVVCGFKLGNIFMAKSTIIASEPVFLQIIIFRIEVMVGFSIQAHHVEKRYHKNNEK